MCEEVADNKIEQQVARFFQSSFAVIGKLAQVDRVESRLDYHQVLVDQRKYSLYFSFAIMNDEQMKIGCS